MKVLVTGGAGFIGANLCRRLIAEGQQVVVLDNLLSGFRENLPAGLSWIEGDIRDRDCLARAAAGCETIFNLAAYVGNARALADPATAQAINADAFGNLLAIAAEAGVAAVIQASSAGVYGETGPEPVRESQALRPIGPYGSSKLAAEALASRCQAPRVVCLRFFNVYGPFQREDRYGNVIPRWLAQVLRAQPLTIYGDGQQTRDFVHVDDVVQACLKAARSQGAQGAYNIGSSRPCRIMELARQLQVLAGVEVKTDWAASRPGDVRDSLADISRAAADFGYAPGVSLDEGLQTYLAWLRQDPLSRLADRALT